MDTSGRLAGRNGYGIRPGVMDVAATDGISIQAPCLVRNGIVLYGRISSLHEAARLYWVKKRRIGTGRFAYSCTCEGNFLGNHLCSHIALFKLAEGNQ